MYSKTRLIIFFILLLFLIFPQKTFAVEVVVNTVNPTDISNKEQIISLGVTITGISTNESYFRLGLDGGVGYTKNDSDQWVQIGTLEEDKSQCTNFYKILSDGDYIFGFKVGDDEIENGSKDLKIHRYTSTCGTYSLMTSTLINILLPTSTPSPSPDPTQAPTTAPTSTPSPTKTSTPKPTPTKSSTPKSTSSPEESEVPEFKVTNVSVDEASETSTPEGLVAGAKTSKFPFQAIGLVVSGLGLMGYGGYTYLTKKKHESKKTF